MTTLVTVPRVTACVLSWNRATDLARTLDALRALAMPLRIAVIDNASTDGSADMLRSAAAADPHLHVRLLDTNIGVAARNQFAGETETEFLLSLDDDSWPRSAEDVGRMVALMDADARIASVCASCVHPDTGVAETARIERFASGGSRNIGYDVVNIAAGGTLLRRAALLQTAGYDAEFFWGREENDLAFQLLQHGWRLTFLPDAVIWHAFSPAGRNPYARLRQVTRNSVWLLWKYFPMPVAILMTKLFALRRLLPVVKDIRRLAPVLGGLATGLGGARRMRRRGRRFTMRESLQLLGWFRKLLHE
jgi:N-acetylglucosaminyl-diphospho-decaprenol L-rhamnosyltransferase